MYFCGAAFAVCRNMPYKRKAQSFLKNIIQKTKGIETS